MQFCVGNLPEQEISFFYEYFGFQHESFSYPKIIKEGDLFQAEQNLNAVIEHYPVQDDGILEEANELMQQIELLKIEVVEEEDPETKIEIDEN